MPSVDSHELVTQGGEQPLYSCPDTSLRPTALLSTLAGRRCPVCKRMVDGPYAGQTFDVAPWEGGALVGADDD
jgi:hypothetical protein